MLYGDVVLKCRYFFGNSNIFLIFTCTLSTAYSPFFDLFHAVQPQNPPFLLRLAIPLTQFKCHSALPNCLQSDYLCVFLYIVLNILCFLRRKFVPLHAITLLSESMKRLSVFNNTDDFRGIVCCTDSQADTQCRGTSFGRLLFP